MCTSHLNNAREMHPFKNYIIRAQFLIRIVVWLFNIHKTAPARVVPLYVFTVHLKNERTNTIQNSTTTLLRSSHTYTHVLMSIHKSTRSANLVYIIKNKTTWVRHWLFTAPYAVSSVLLLSHEISPSRSFCISLSLYSMAAHQLKRIHEHSDGTVSPLCIHSQTKPHRVAYTE